MIVAGSIMEDEVKAVTDSNGSHPSKSYIYGAAKYSAHMMAKPLAVSLGVDLILGQDNERLRCWRAKSKNVEFNDKEMH